MCVVEQSLVRLFHEVRRSAYRNSYIGARGMQENAREEEPGEVGRNGWSGALRTKIQGCKTGAL